MAFFGWWQPPGFVITYLTKNYPCVLVYFTINSIQYWIFKPNQGSSAYIDLVSRAFRLQHIFKNSFSDLLKKWCQIIQTKLGSHSEKLIIMEKIQPESTVEDSSVSTREVERGVKNVGFTHGDVALLLFYRIQCLLDMWFIHAGY